MKFKALILEDNETDASLLKHCLLRSEYQFDVKWVRSGEEYEETLGRFSPDIIISDYRLKQYTGLDALRFKNMHMEDIPLMVVSGTIGEEKAVGIIREGAADFLIKNNITNRLEQAAIRAIKEAREKRKRRVAESNLKKEQEFISQALDSLPGLFYVLDESQSFIRISKNFTHELGYSWQEVKDMHPLDFYFEEDHELVMGEIRKAFSDGESKVVARMKRKDGSVGHYYLTGLYMQQDGDDYIMGTGTDISERINAENQVKRALQEKEVLLAEVHHRVKNNLAVVSGMMQLQAFNSSDEQLNSKLLDSVSRIKSIALIHEYLYQDNSLTHIKMDHNIRGLTEKIQETLDIKTEVTFCFELQNVTLNVNQAVPFALIINEVITNIYKHAFPEREKGNITIELTEEDELVSLVIRDNGIGLPEGFDFRETDTLGMTLINTLCRQLDAEVEFETKEETVFHLRFNHSENIGSSNALR